ncbi:UNVERIFIED_CONTAM: RNA recognition motif-containing protein [Hammondia hammondi]|eukprot:XP_008887201.1 RNA recognition motif-containing protein [Hammondia hammondi]
MTQGSAEPALPVAEGGKCEATVLSSPADAAPKPTPADSPSCSVVPPGVAAPPSDTPDRQAPSEKQEARTSTVSAKHEQGEARAQHEAAGPGKSREGETGDGSASPASADKKEEKCGETTTSTVRVHRWADESDDLDSPSFDPMSSAEVEPPEFDLGMSGYQPPSVRSTGNGIVSHADAGGYRRGVPGQSSFSGGYGGLVDSRFGGLVNPPHGHPHGPPASLGLGDGGFMQGGVTGPFTEVYVAELDAHVTEEDVSCIFAPGLTVRNVRIVREQANRGNKGGPNATCGAYVTFHSPEDAQRALSFHGKLYRPPRGGGLSSSQGLRGSSRQAGSGGSGVSARVLRISAISSPPLLSGEGGSPYLLSRATRSGSLGHVHSAGSPHLLPRGGRGFGGVYGQAVADLHQQAASLPFRSNGTAPGPGPAGPQGGRKAFPGDETARGDRGREPDGTGKAGGAGFGAGRRKKSKSPDFSELRKETGAGTARCPGTGAQDQRARGRDEPSVAGAGPRAAAAGDREETTPPEPPRERPKLLLKPRSKPLDATAEPPKLNPAIFGAAKPIDDPVAKRQPTDSGASPASGDSLATASSERRASGAGPVSPRGENGAGLGPADASVPSLKRGDAAKGRGAAAERPAEKESRGPRVASARGSGLFARREETQTGTTEDGRQKGRAGGSQKGPEGGEQTTGAHAHPGPGRERGEKERDDRSGLYSGTWRHSAERPAEKESGEDPSADAKDQQAPQEDEHGRRTSGISKGEARTETERKPSRTGDPFGGARPRDEFEWQRKKEAAATPSVLPEDPVRVSPLQHPPLSPYLPHGAHSGRPASGFLPPSYASYGPQSEIGSHPGALGPRGPDESARTPPSGTPDGGNSSRGILGPSPSARSGSGAATAVGVLGGSGASPSGAPAKGSNSMGRGPGPLAPTPVGPGGSPGSPLKGVAQTPPRSAVASSLQPSPNASPSMGPGIWGRSLQGSPPMQKGDGAPRGGSGGRPASSAGAQKEPLWRSSVSAGARGVAAGPHDSPSLLPGGGRGVSRPTVNNQVGEGLLPLGRGADGKEQDRSALSGDGVLAAPMPRGESEEGRVAPGPAGPTPGTYEGVASWARKPQNPIHVRAVQTVVLAGGGEQTSTLPLLSAEGLQDRGARETGRGETRETGPQTDRPSGMRSLAEQLLPSQATDVKGKAAEEKEEEKKKENKVPDILSKPEQKQGQTVWEARNEVLGLAKRDAGAGEETVEVGDSLEGREETRTPQAPKSAPREGSNEQPGTSGAASDGQGEEEEGREGERGKGRRSVQLHDREARGQAHSAYERGGRSSGYARVKGEETPHSFQVARGSDGGPEKRDEEGRRHAGHRDARGGRGGRFRGGERTRWRRYPGDGGDATPSERTGDNQGPNAAGDHCFQHAETPETPNGDDAEQNCQGMKASAHCEGEGEKGRRRGESQASSAVHDFPQAEKSFRRRGGDRGRGTWRGADGRPDGAGRGRGGRKLRGDGVGISNSHQPGRHTPGHRREQPGAAEEEREPDSQAPTPRLPARAMLPQAATGSTGVKTNNRFSAFAADSDEGESSD